MCEQLENDVPARSLNKSYADHSLQARQQIGPNSGPLAVYASFSKKIWDLHDPMPPRVIETSDPFDPPQICIPVGAPISNSHPRARDISGDDDDGARP